MRRRDCCWTRYEMLCFTLLGENGSKLYQKCTTDSYGAPFNKQEYSTAGDHGTLHVEFPNVEKVKTLLLSFNAGDPGQIADLKVYGFVPCKKTFFFQFFRFILHFNQFYHFYPGIKKQLKV